MSIKVLRIYCKIRNFLFSIVNKEFLIFLFFLVLSGSFWLLMTLNETYEKEISINLSITNVPKSVIITNDVPSTVRFTVRDKGYMIAGYLYGSLLHPISIDFRTYADGKGHGNIPISDMQKLIYQQLYNSSKIVNTKPDKIDFYYNFGRKKKVPVRMQGTVSPNNGYYLSEVKFSPDSVTVYAPKELLDSIQTIYTERQFIVNFHDTLTREVSLNKIHGAKIVPAKTTMRLIPDILTEESVEVPIEAINTPENKLMRTFPSKVKLKFVVGANHLRKMPKNAETRKLLPKGFRVVVDYKNVMENPSEKCRLTILTIPRGIKNVQPEISEVDYIIEQQ